MYTGDTATLKISSAEIKTMLFSFALSVLLQAGFSTTTSEQLLTTLSNLNLANIGVLETQPSSWVAVGNVTLDSQADKLRDFALRKSKQDEYVGFEMKALNCEDEGETVIIDLRESILEGDPTLKILDPVMCFKSKMFFFQIGLLHCKVVSLFTKDHLKCGTN